MELNKFKIEKKRVLQIILFLAGASIIFFTYFSNLEKEDSTFVSEKIETIKPKDQYSDEKAQTNKFEDVEYKGIDTNGNRFVIGSQYANFEVEKPELINMENIKCLFYFKDGTILRIKSDYGIYNNITLDMEFSKNVKMNYLDNKLSAEKINFSNTENQLLVQGNVRGDGPAGSLIAEKLNFDLNSKKVGVSSNKNDKVNIKLKY